MKRDNTWNLITSYIVSLWPCTAAECQRVREIFSSKKEEKCKDMLRLKEPHEYYATYTSRHYVRGAPLCANCTSRPRVEINESPAKTRSFGAVEKSEAAIFLSVGSSESPQGIHWRITEKPRRPPQSLKHLSAATSRNSGGIPFIFPFVCPPALFTRQRLPSIRISYQSFAPSDSIKLRAINKAPIFAPRAFPPVERAREIN